MPPEQATAARLRRIVVDTSDPDWALSLPRLLTPAEGPVDTVRGIIADVRRRGDAALRELTARLDGVATDAIVVSRHQIDEAMQRTASEVVDSLRVAADRIERFHRHQRREPVTLTEPGSTILSYETPVDAAGCYVPGGRAAYPSTLLMTAVPARVAGVERIAVCVPPARETGTISDVTLAAAAVAGVDEVYAVGGAQAIAAMAYGTESIDRVDVVAGPGNMYVATAKALVAGDVGVAAAFAGPSEIVVVADGSVPARFVAVDLMVQAEHGPDGLAWLVCADVAVADAVDEELAALVAESPRAAEIGATLMHNGYCVVVDDPAAAVAVADRIAPEHLQLMVRDAAELAGKVRHAGAIFVGPMSPASLGDYAAGPSHVLPTHGTARFASALTTADFVRQHHVVTFDADGLVGLGPHVERLAMAEGLTSHAQSIRMRLDSITGGDSSVSSKLEAGPLTSGSSSTDRLQ